MNESAKVEFETIDNYTTCSNLDSSIENDSKPIEIINGRKSKDKKYIQRYSQNWEKNPLFKEWLTAVAGDPTHAFCKFCHVTILAKKKSLADHAKSKKHEKGSERVSIGVVADKQYDINVHPTTYVITILEKLIKDQVLIEGKTKVVFSVVASPSLVIIENKDTITAFDGARKDTLQGKAEISNSTNAKVFAYLNHAGIKSSFLKTETDTSYSARKCHMIPIEFVCRRVATGSYLKRFSGITEGYRFKPPKLETFMKDDTNNDPIISQEQILESQWNIGGIIIGKLEYDTMLNTTLAVFEILERAWKSVDCSLIDMKVEFGVDAESREIILSDVIDCDSWRLWPSGDKRLMKDKQVYRNLEEVTPESLTEVLNNFEWVSQKLDSFLKEAKGMAVILMGSQSDHIHCELIRTHCEKFGIKCQMRVTSAHKSTSETLKILAEYEDMSIPIVYIAVAGRSNGLGPVVAGNTAFPVINCPPLSKEDTSQDIWSSLKTPSGIGCSTVLYPEAAAEQTASILALSDHTIWSKCRANLLNNWKKIVDSDRFICSQLAATELGHMG